jgi:serine/threonine protein kinase
MRRAAAESSDAHEIVGTATYMAPEQAFGEAPTPAVDWYSVGVMLYEALVGSAPFVGPITDVLAKKISTDPAPPSPLTPRRPRRLRPASRPTSTPSASTCSAASRSIVRAASRSCAA